MARIRSLALLPLVVSLTVLGCSDSSPPTAPNQEVFTPYEWAVSTPEDQGLDSDALDLARREAEARLFIHSLLVVRNGHLVHESYFHGYAPDESHNVYSVTKSVTSTLVGIAIEKGYLPGVEAKLMDYLPEYDTPALAPRIRDITLGQLLEMRSGLGEDGTTFYNVVYTDDWIQATLEQGITAGPGTQFQYTTSGVHLLSVVLSRATGMTTLEFAKEHLFDPLGMVCTDWFADPLGYHWGGNYMNFTPQHMARYGAMYLAGGEIDRKRVVSEGWIEAAYQTTSGGDWTWGDLTENGYGYLWWLGNIGPYTARLALGHGGQTILLLPELDMIVVTTSYANPDFTKADEQERSVVELVKNYILPALLPRAQARLEIR